MLTRRSHILTSIFFSLILLVCVWTGAAELPSIYTVDLEDEEARNKESRIPPVCFVKFIYPQEYQIRNQQQQCLSVNENNCTISTNGSTSLNATFERSGSPSVTFTFNIIFDSSLEVGCSNYIPNIRFDAFGDAREILCNPTASCSKSTTLNDEDIGIIQWRRFANNSFPQNLSGIAVISNDVTEPVRANDSTLILYFNETDIRYEMVGYYVVSIPVNGENVTAQTFLLYANPELDSSSGVQTVTYSYSNAKDFTKMFCRFYSFPTAFISWDAPSGSNYTTIDTGNELNIEDEIEPTLSINGRLVFEEVQYEDGGEYTCIAENNFTGVRAYDTIRLRVRNPLRPLWPALGILGSFIITFLLIIGGSLWDKALRKITSAPDDEGGFQRNYSVISNMGEDSGESRRARKHKAAGKRISITQQELLANASDPN